MVNKTFININFTAIPYIPKPKPKSAKNNTAMNIERIEIAIEIFLNNWVCSVAKKIHCIIAQVIEK